MRRNISELKAKIAELETVKFDVGYRIDELRRQLWVATDKQTLRRLKQRRRVTTRPSERDRKGSVARGQTAVE